MFAWRACFIKRAPFISDPLLSLKFPSAESPKLYPSAPLDSISPKDLLKFVPKGWDCFFLRLSIAQRRHFWFFYSLNPLIYSLYSVAHKDYCEYYISLRK
ncbi:hypothetical protein K443DRAFT_594138 [Laccaria amethystina LaAM-08-1]|uniref:Uncharacterized protein n=1 Tax=Laccaria amethystina LaAM-08-1 TaxID=1095629 RepID=A0A0C9XYH1_9AGAR|nr:hypothetical protein K443DRAFT_594138 [Laccaria amethystina LaAM-08-1]